MVRHFSFDDRRVGKGDGDFFKVTGTQQRPQRIAYIPFEATEQMLVVTPQMRARASSGDPAAIEAIEDIQALKDEITKSLRKQVPSAEIWTNEHGQRVILYAKTEGAKTFWIDNIGYVYWKEGIPAHCLEKPPQIVYGFVLLEYELDSDNDPVVLPPDRQIDLGGGHKLTFKYDLKPWSINDAKTRSWKDHSRTNPVIMNDYMVWQQKEGKFDRTKFSPAGPAIWRKDPLVMARIIREARKLYDNLPKLIAKDFTVDEIVEMCSGGRGRDRDEDVRSHTMAEEINFADLLGSTTGAHTETGHTAVGQGFTQPADPAALEHAPTDPVQTEFPDLGSTDSMESLIEPTSRG